MTTVDGSLSDRLSSTVGGMAVDPLGDGSRSGDGA